MYTMYQMLFCLYCYYSFTRTVKYVGLHVHVCLLGGQCLLKQLLMINPFETETCTNFVTLGHSPVMKLKILTCVPFLTDQATKYSLVYY